MIEEIKQDNNCIIKAFENNPISIIHEELDGKKNYWFKAADIGIALNLSNIRVSIQSYDDDEKGVRKAYTVQGEQDTVYLSSQGVYRLLYNSKKPEAKKFRKWAGNILDDIIFNESTELKKQLEQQKQLFIEQKEQTDLEKEVLLETTLLQQFPINTQCIYIGKIDNKDAKNGNLVSFGMSNNLNERIKIHKKTYTNFRLISVFKVKNHIEIENCIKQHSILKQRIRYLMINNINYREHLLVDSDKKDPDFSLNKLFEYIKRIQY